MRSNSSFAVLSAGAGRDSQTLNSSCSAQPRTGGSSSYPFIRDSRIALFMANGFDLAKDDINREGTGCPGVRHWIFEDADQLIIPSIRKRDGEERFKVIGTVREKLFYRCVHLSKRSAPVHIREMEQQR